MNLMKVIDLSLKISPAIKVFPGSPKPSLIPWNSFSAHGYDSEAVFMSTHTGTHMDAPSHFVSGHPSIDKIPSNRFVSEAKLVRIRKNAKDLVERSELEGHGLRQNDAVVIVTGWEKRIRSKNYMTENPGLSAGAARYLASKKVSLVAIDGPSIDAGTDHSFSAHKILLRRNVLIVENLCNLQKMPAMRFILVVAPLKLKGSTGSPVRALAVIL